MHDSAAHAQAMQLPPILCTTHGKTHIINQISQQTMQHSHHLLSLLIPLLMASLSPDSAAAQNTVAECGPSLLQLAPCAPFVQGTAPAPVQSCCMSLNQLYAHTPSCLCLLLHDNTLASAFPINTTLALQLPLICKLQLDASTCGGALLPSLAPPSHVTSGAKPNSTVAATPIDTGAPRPSLMGFRFHHSGEVRVKVKSQLWMLLLVAILTLFTKISY